MMVHLPSQNNQQNKRNITELPKLLDKSFFETEKCEHIYKGDLLGKTGGKAYSVTFSLGTCRF